MIKNFFTVLFIMYLVEGMGQNFMDTIVHIPEIEIAAHRLDIPFKEQSRAIEVITAAELNTLPVQNLAEALQYYSGMDIRRRGVNGVQADAGIRGGTFDQTLVLINGIKMNDQQTGHHSLNLPISINDIERIEIIKGPAAKIYGQNAFAGVINVITKNPKSFSVNAELNYGSFKSDQAYLNINLPIRKYKQALSLYRQSSDGYRYNTDYTISGANYNAQFLLSQNNKLKIDAGFVERKFGANAFYASEEFKDQYEEVQTSFVSLRNEIKRKNWVIQNTCSWRRNQDIYLFVRNDPDFYRNRHLGNRISGESSVNIFLFENFILGGGVELAKEYLRSNNLGDYERTILGGYIDTRWYVTSKLFFHPGIFINKWSDNEVQFLPGIDITYDFSPFFSLFASTNLANRIPTYTDLYYTSPAESGNPNLTNESMTSMELGIHYKKNFIKTDFSIYRNLGRNLIDWARDSMSVQWMARNIGSVNTQGLEGKLSLQIDDLINLPFGLVVSYQINLLSSNLENTLSRQSRYALDNLSDQHNYGIHVTLFERLRITALGRTLLRNGFVDDDEFSFTILDSKVSFELGDLQFFINANNLLDTSYRETSLVLMPGRNFLFGIKGRLF